MNDLITINPTISVDSRADQEHVRQIVGVQKASVKQSLADYITGRLTTPFAWGTHDCVCFAVGWAEIATGIDYLAPYQPWANQEQAHAIIARVGGLEKMFDQHLQRIAPGYARDGDITLVDGTAFLFSGAHIVGPGRDGLVFKSRREAICAWSY